MQEIRIDFGVIVSHVIEEFVMGQQAWGNHG